MTSNTSNKTIKLLEWIWFSIYINQIGNCISRKWKNDQKYHSRYQYRDYEFYKCKCFIFIFYVCGFHDGNILFFLPDWIYFDYINNLPFFKMIKKTSWESFVWIIVWVFILSIVILWVANIIIYSNNIIDSYSDYSKVTVLRENLTNIVKNIDTSEIRENEIFYVHKNNTSKEFEVFTGSVNSGYKYINEFWDTVPNIALYEWDIYSRILWLSREDTTLSNQDQIVKVSIRKLIKDI